MNIIIDKLFTSKIIKIFHGGESLDFPYLINVIKDPEKIYKFLRYSFDTKFLCEYYKSFKNEKQKCNIYDAMLYFNVMTKEKYDELEVINIKNGPIWKVNWDNINKNTSLPPNSTFNDFVDVLTSIIPYVEPTFGHVKTYEIVLNPDRGLVS